MVFDRFLAERVSSPPDNRRQDRYRRALPEALGAVGPDRGPAFAQIAADCSNAFLRHFVRPDLHLMAYQTLNDTGEPLDAIPATPDADPGYHTGLSIIDYLDALAGAAGGENR